MKWRAWFTRNREFIGEGHAHFLRLPATGAIRFNLYCETGFTSYDGADWYWSEGGTIKKIPSQSWDGYEPKPLVSCASCVKRGDAVSDEEFARVSEQGQEAVTWQP